MGSLVKLSRLDDVEIIERYLAGESKSMLVLRTVKRTTALQLRQ